MSGFKGEYNRRYTGVYQRKNGTWYYRVKILMPNGEYKFFQESGFENEEQAHKARQSALRWVKKDNYCEAPPAKPLTLHEVVGTSFPDAFEMFLNTIEKESTKKKYKAMYSAQLAERWKNRSALGIGEQDIDTLLLALTNSGYKQTYISSLRRMLVAFKKCVNFDIWHEIDGEFIEKKKRKLSVLSLFSGIGAPEQALKNLQIDYDLVKYCEVDDTASKAYCILHHDNESIKSLAKKRIPNVLDIDEGYCEKNLPTNIDLMTFGFPCTAVSGAGKREGVAKEHPSLHDIQYLEKEDFLRVDENGEKQFTATGLFYKALQIALWVKPKFMLAENVSALVSKQFKADFDVMCMRLQEAGYNIYFNTYNSRQFNVPQNRSRLFMVMVRSDLALDFSMPDILVPVFAADFKEFEEKGKVAPTPIKASEWFVANAGEEYYLKGQTLKTVQRKMENGENRRSNFNTDYISCLTTGIGTAGSGVPQTLVKDEQGRIRILTSEELMRFQGFPPEYGTLLYNNGISRGSIGHLVGNSITVPVVQAVLKNFIDCIGTPIKADVVPRQVLTAHENNEFVQPLFAYDGNKSKLLNFLKYAWPSQLYLDNCHFVDLFAGSGFVGLNTLAGNVTINEVDSFLTGIYKGIIATEPQKAWELVEGVVNEYGIVPGEDSTAFQRCRAEYNKIEKEEREREYWYWGLALVYCGYNRNHVSHNLNGEFNTAFGKLKSDIGKSKDKFIAYATAMHNSNIRVVNKSYADFNIRMASEQALHIGEMIDKKATREEINAYIDKDIADADVFIHLDEYAFVYVDPPYFITDAIYNKYWKEEDEIALYEYLDALSAKGVNWMLSNVIENKGRKNTILTDWIKKNHHPVYFLPRDYSTVNKAEQGTTIEVMVINYTI